MNKWLKASIILVICLFVIGGLLFVLMTLVPLSIFRSNTEANRKAITQSSSSDGSSSAVSAGFQEDSVNSQLTEVTASSTTPVIQETSEAVFILPVDHHAELKYGIASFFRGDTSLCDKFQRPYDVGPAQEVSTQRRECKEIFDDINALAGAQRAQSASDCKSTFDPSRNIYAPDNDLCEEAASSPDLAFVLPIYIHFYTREHYDNESCRRGEYCVEYAENNERLMEYYDKLRNEPDRNADAATCRNLRDVDVKDLCTKMMAEQQQNPSVCNSIIVDPQRNTTRQWKDFCFIAIAKQLRDQNVCIQVSADMDAYGTNRNRCYFELATLTKDISLCDQISYQQQKDRCTRSLNN